MGSGAQRQLVVHVDDVGNSHGSNVAFAQLYDLGAVTSGSVMVPCPWFPEAAAMARRRPDWDLGVHLTLTAEFEGYRWRPLTGVSGNGLTDAEGFMWRKAADLRRADPAAVEVELRAQIDAALAAGIDATHLDAHMGTVLMPEFVDIYIRLGADYRLPIMLPRTTASVTPAPYDAAQAAHLAGQIDGIVARGNPDFAGFIVSDFRTTVYGADTYRRIFDASPPGLTWGAFHMTAPGDFEPVSADAPMRTAEYALFRSGAAGALLDELGIERIGMRPFRDAMRKAAS